VSLTTKPATAGNLTANVVTDGASSGPVQVATVIPVVLPNAGYRLPANANTVTINGSGFDASTPGNNTVLFNDGANGTVIGATATSLTVSFANGVRPTTAGNLTAVVTTDLANSTTPVTVATVTPVVSSSAATQAANVTTLTINGFGFDPAGNNTVVFNDGANGTVGNATATSLSVTFGNLPATSRPWSRPME
jgi:hypothetical protein